MGSALEVNSSEVSNPESTGVESDSSLGAATKAMVFWNCGLNVLLEACGVVLFWGGEGGGRSSSPEAFSST